MKKDALIIVRGGGDLATGTIHRLCSAGLRVLVLETTQPAAIRRQVALCEAVYEGEATVEGLRAVRIEALEQAQSVWAQGAVPVLVDPEGACIARAKPEVVVDAILAKRNLGTSRDMAPLTIALGPGFVAGQDVDAVVETKRGHRLGRIIREGSAIPNTGIPGVIGGYGAERVIHAQAAGVFMNVRKIGDLVVRLLPPSAPRRGQKSRSQHRFPAFCADCCAAAIRLRRALRLRISTPGGRSFPTVS